MVQRLDLSSLNKAVSSLMEAMNAYQQQSDNQFIRDATIQRFEYTYELCHKMLKRYLSLTEPSVEVVDEMAFATLIRTGAERGLLEHSWDQWQVYRYARNMTVHTYDQAKALEVLKIVPLFASEAQFFLQQLQDRVESS